MKISKKIDMYLMKKIRFPIAPYYFQWSPAEQKEYREVIFPETIKTIRQTIIMVAVSVVLVVCVEVIRFWRG